MKEILDRIIGSILELIFPKKIAVQKIEKMSAKEFALRVRKADFEISADFPIYSFFSYKDPLVRISIHQVKYLGNKNVARLFAKILKDSLIAELSDEISYTNFVDPLIVPIPSHNSKMRQKGFNQTILILEELSKISPFGFTNALIKIKKTKDQIGLNRKKRLENNKGSFEIKEGFQMYIKNRNILVFDDVFTSGGTMNEAKRVLKQAGARRVVGLTLAH